MDVISIVVGLLGGLVVGVLVAFVLQKSALKSKTNAILKEAEVDAEALKKEKILQAKERFLQLKDEHEKAVRDREKRFKV